MRDGRQVPAGYPSGPAAALVGHDLPDGADLARSLVLVEGVSDRIAVESLATRRGIDLSGARIVVVATGGAQGMLRMLRNVTERNRTADVLGLYDEGEHEVVRGALVRAGRLSDASSLDAAGFFACHRDLEDELIRACGAARIEELLAATGELASFRRMQAQPDWRGRTVEAQLHRWISGGARRKLRFAGLLVEACSAAAIPRPLAAVLERAVDGQRVTRS